MLVSFESHFILEMIQLDYVRGPDPILTKVYSKETSTF